MSYINWSVLDQLDYEQIQNSKGFPWLNIANTLTAEGMQKLLENMPATEMFQLSKNIPRKHGQKPHNRLYLQYNKGLDIPSPWIEFIEELYGSKYSLFLKKLFNLKWNESCDLYCHWHFAQKGDSVSPHCDGKTKLGSHIFYLNNDKDWKSEWGGQTTVFIDNDGKHKCESAPEFEDFDEQIEVVSIAPWSLLAYRNERSWHGVKEIVAPEGKLRKIFIVVIEKRTILQRLKHNITGKPQRVGY